MTTPEQLQAWQDEAEAIWTKDHTLNSPYPKQHFIAGYLRRCQETEQAIKDARKQAIEDCANFAKDWAMEHVIQDDATMSVGDYVIKSMELLK